MRLNLLFSRRIGPLTHRLRGFIDVAGPFVLGLSIELADAIDCQFPFEDVGKPWSEGPTGPAGMAAPGAFTFVPRITYPAGEGAPALNGRGASTVHLARSTL